MNPKIIGTVIAIAFSLIFLIQAQQTAYASSGLKVNVNIENNLGRSITADIIGYDGNDNRETSERGIFLNEGDNEVQIEYEKGVIPVGDSFKVCVFSVGIKTECVTGTNHEKRAPETVFINLDGNSREFSGSSSASSSDSSSGSSASSSSSAGINFCFLGPCDSPNANQNDDNY